MVININPWDSRGKFFIMEHKKIAIACDFESVLVPEIWPELGRALKLPQLSLTTREVGNFQELMKVRVAALSRAGVSVRRLAEIAAAIKPLPGAEEFINFLNERPIDYLVVSDTFQEIAALLFKKLKIKTYFVNKFIIKEGAITGLRLDVNGRKDRVVMHQLSLDKTLLIAVGDSSNDAAMLRLADLKILINPAQGLKKFFSDSKVFENVVELRRYLEDNIKI